MAPLSDDRRRDVGENDTTAFAANAGRRDNSSAFAALLGFCSQKLISGFPASFGLVFCGRVRGNVVRAVLVFFFNFFEKAAARFFCAQIEEVSAHMEKRPRPRGGKWAGLPVHSHRESPVRSGRGERSTGTSWPQQRSSNMLRLTTDLFRPRL